MKNLKQKFVFALLIALLAICGAPRAEAWVKVTVTNNRSHTMSLAFCWSGYVYAEDGGSKGWYNVKPGESRTITINDAISSLTMREFGYYAKGTPKGGKTLYWRGKESDEDSRFFKYWIHPTKSFTGTEYSESGENRPISGGQKVIFRRVNVKESYDRMDGTASFTFNN